MGNTSKKYNLRLSATQARFLLELVEDDLKMTELTLDEKSSATSIQHRLRDIVTPEWRNPT